jgi:DNA (cytosine-5)-methyltransferase 1
VDTTQTITHIGLCAGYGGIELGLARVLPTLRSIALCEIEAFAIANLVAKMEAGLMDPAPIWTDLKTFPWEEFRDKVDVLSGGYPCQPFSAAGKRLGTDDPRHLWPYIASGIRLLRPKLCFFENVEGHISLGLREVVGELESLGYETTWGIFSAAEVGAPHQRKRVFIMAQSSGFRSKTGLSRQITGHEGKSGITDDCGAQRWPSRPGQPQHTWEPPRVVGHTSGKRWQQNSTLRDQQQTGGASQISREGRGKSMGNAEGRMSGQSSTGDWRESAGRASEGAKSMGNTSMLDGTGQTRGQWEAQVGGASATQHGGEIEQPLGRNFNESSSGVDYAQLCVSCDNRTDELRLLGNGVVPATAELAFRTLWNEL